jgi:hypothetical protein
MTDARADFANASMCLVDSYMGEVNRKYLIAKNRWSKRMTNKNANAFIQAGFAAEKAGVLCEGWMANVICPFIALNMGNDGVRTLTGVRTCDSLKT